MKKLNSIGYKTALFGVASLMISLSQVTVSSANLVYLGEYNETGLGYGAVDNILSFHKVPPPSAAGEATDVEIGKVAWTPSGDVITNTAYVIEKQTQTYNLGSYLGITDASQISLVWDASETGNDAGKFNQLDSVTMSIYDHNGSGDYSVFSASLLDVPMPLSVINPGLGGGDYTFGLDAAQAAELNAIIGTNWDQYSIGLAASHSYIDGGQDTWLVGKGPGTTPVPEPTTMLLFGTGLVGLASLARRKRS